jgi:hypothetical protein
MTDYKRYTIDAIPVMRARMIDGDRKAREKVCAFVNKVYGILMDMKPLEAMNIEKNVQPANREIFIRTVCLFVHEGNTDYEFTPDWSAVRRLAEKPENAIRRLNAELERKRVKKQLYEHKTI